VPAKTMQLWCRQEVLECWFSSQILPRGLQQSLRAMLAEAEEQLQVLHGVRS